MSRALSPAELHRRKTLSVPLPYGSRSDRLATIAHAPDSRQAIRAGFLGACAEHLHPDVHAPSETARRSRSMHQAPGVSSMRLTSPSKRPYDRHPLSKAGVARLRAGTLKAQSQTTHSGASRIRVQGRNAMLRVSFRTSPFTRGHEGA